MHRRPQDGALDRVQSHQRCEKNTVGTFKLKLCTFVSVKRQLHKHPLPFLSMQVITKNNKLFLYAQVILNVG